MERGVEDNGKQVELTFRPSPLPPLFEACMHSGPNTITKLGCVTVDAVEVGKCDKNDVKLCMIALCGIRGNYQGFNVLVGSTQCRCQIRVRDVTMQ